MLVLLVVNSLTNLFELFYIMIKRFNKLITTEAYEHQSLKDYNKFIFCWNWLKEAKKPLEKGYN